MNRFVNAMDGAAKWKLTENGADALNTTNSALLDLFSVIGAARTRSDTEIIQMFLNAFNENRLLAVKTVFYARNVRGGLGERRVARVIWKWLAMYHPEIMQKNLKYVPEMGRYDDLYEFVNTPIEENMWELIKQQIKADVENMKKEKEISLLTKWLKSVNTSSKESCRLGKLTAKKLGLSEKAYRKSLSMTRYYLNVVEKKMSAKYWKNINYEGVPSKAMTNYRKAFAKRDPERFAEYMAKVTAGKAKIHSGTLFPYDIVEKVFAGESNPVLEEQWRALPNYIEGEHNILVMADVSGSMSMHTIRPLATSVGLAVYFAERNKGAFHNKFMTFSAEPDFVTLSGNTLYEKLWNTRRARWTQNTDIEKAFRKILKVAIDNKLSQEELPEALVIISDMEFDEATRGTGYKKTYYQNMKDLYAQCGYKLPRVVFWNVDARQSTFHATMQDGVQFASGQATSVFKSILDNKEVSAYEMMLNVLNDPMYAGVTI
jgi:hypothetical protein